jgi:hypothetical protein
MQEMKGPLLIMISLVLGSTVVGTTSNAQKADPFADVPSSQRERLRLRLVEFIDYHRTKQWNKVYDLLAERDKNAVEGGLPRDIFLKKKLYSTVRKFTAKSLQKMDNDWWTVWGCADFDRGGNMEAALEAYLQDGDWYFSDIWSSPPCIDCTPQSCRH